jgi:glucose-6-phosphate dehydrogenase assembly protein OpcA
MAESIENLGAGLPVEVGRIERELKKLWEQSGGAATRASLINFAIYCEGADQMAKNTKLIAEFTQDHACRAILIGIERAATQPRVQAWISAHCHISRAGAKQVCCEQISFLIEGNSPEMIPNIVFSHLDSDLPLYLWWRGDFSREIDAQLWTWVDRLIFDSQKWDDARGQLARLRDSLAQIRPRLILCDLNWTRLLHLRWALAQLFDHPANVSELPKLARVEIVFAPKHRTTAILLLGWLAAQLQWKLAEKTDGGFSLARSVGGRVDITLREEAGAAISECAMHSDGATFRIKRESGSAEFFHSEVEYADGRKTDHLVPAGKDDLIELLNEELMRGGKHKVYLRALAAAEPLL